MAFGVDYTNGLNAGSAAAKGVTFACRYLSVVNSATRYKLLSHAEAQDLSNHGIAVVSNFEWTTSRATEGYNAGVADAKLADSQHRACGGDPSRPIYFSVDSDYSAAVVTPYFQGLCATLGSQRVGVYGSYRVVSGLAAAGLAKWYWQTYAWSRGKWYSGNHIEQYNNGQSLAGASVDFDRSKTADFGQWFADQHVNITDEGDNELRQDEHDRLVNADQTANALIRMDDQATLTTGGQPNELAAAIKKLQASLDALTAIVVGK